MYKYILILIVGIFTVNSTNAQWRKLIAAQTYGFATNPQNSKTIFVGGIDRKLYRSFDGGISWDTLSVGFVSDGPKITNIFIHPIDTNIIIAGGLGLGTIQRSTDGGNTWKIVSTWDYPISMPSETIINDVNNSDVIYAANKNRSIIFKSINKGATWDSISRVPAFAVCTLQ
ncbi:MAG: hypothetical protein IPM69_10605 [Ignavibacteria bacterium]|nr:hypothetical protein [Ignavibacteria bacterium]